MICPGLGSISVSLLNLWHSKRSNYKTTIFLIKLQEWLRMYISFKHSLWTIISNPDYLQRPWSSWNPFTWPRPKKFTKLCASVGQILHTRIERMILNGIVNGYFFELKSPIQPMTTTCPFAYVYRSKVDLTSATCSKLTFHGILFTFIFMDRFKNVPSIKMVLDISRLSTLQTITYSFNTEIATLRGRTTAEV